MVIALSKHAEVTHELGLVRKIVQSLAKKPSVYGPITQEYLRSNGLGRVERRADGLVVIERAGHEAFAELAERLVTRFPEMERGLVFANFQTELFGFLADTYLGCDPLSIDVLDESAICDHFEAWFAKLATRRTVFVPCILGNSWSPRFSIGPVSFIHIDDASRSEFYPRDDASDILSRKGFDDMLQLMKEMRTSWLACVPIEGSFRSPCSIGIRSFSAQLPQRPWTSLKASVTWDHISAWISL